MDMTGIMIESAMTQFARAAAEKYDGEARDRDTLIAHGQKLWADKGDDVMAVITENIEGVKMSAGLRQACEEMFVNGLLEALHEAGARAGHTPVEVEWKLLGEVQKAAALPDAAESLSNYVMAWQEEPTTRFLYAPADFHTFGRTWSYDDDNKWQLINEATFRLGSARQEWTGAYDAARGGLVGWNIDSGSPVAVLVKDGGITALCREDIKNYSDDPVERLACSDVPTDIEEDSWSDAAAIFGLDRARNVWVMLAEQGVYELDTGNRWRRIADTDTALLPEDVQGRTCYSDEGAGAVWDCALGEVVFWFGADDNLHFVSWDGERLAQISNDGLPEDLIDFEKGAVVGESPTWGITVYTGPEHGLWIRSEGEWKADRSDRGAGKYSKSTSMALDRSGTVLLGPGRYLGDDDDFDDQHVFYYRKRRRWKLMGKEKRASEVKRIKGGGGWSVLGAAAGRVFATAWRNSLETSEWTDDGWKPVVDGAAGTAAYDSGSRLRACLSQDGNGNLVAITGNGAVFTLSGDTWSKTASDDDCFGDRRSFAAVYSPKHRAIVAWGGELDEQKTNDTLLFADGAWRMLPPSRRTADLDYNWDDNGFDVEFGLVFDTALGAPLRVGFEEVAVLVDDEWRPATPPFMLDYVRPSGRAVVHDEQSGETVLVQWRGEQGTIVRFDLGGFDLVGTFEPPEESSVPFRDWIYDPATRSLLTFDEDDADERFALDLSSAFDLAASIGPRTTDLPESPPPAVRLYKTTDDGIDVFHADGVSGAVRVRTGAIGGELSDEKTAVEDAAAELERLSADRIARGYVTADALDDDALRRAVATPSQSVNVGDGPGEGHSRVGGLPNLGDHDWPEDDDDQPMGFLCQIALPDGDGAVAVFCTTSGHATEDEDENHAVLLSAEDLAAAPTALPDGVPALAERVITFGDPVLEIAKQTIAALGKQDAVLGKRLETLAAATPETGLSKRGGSPWYLQSAISSYPLVFQIAAEDFDHEGGGWDEAGLFGVLYVFDPDDPEAAWQYD